MGSNVIVHYILLVAALISFFLAFVRFREPLTTPAPQVSVGWLGMCFFMFDVLLFGAKVVG